ncbi:hypothetical protein CHM34_04255 [Paludifilum halophilum]|uniref:Uncharacterized protein n=1 Tax=Paludifilum halophilum TaxID=1642702 RepID=A0A235B9K6_9BACL|nr:hypothetical protein CHM34_04255 [Paludifilum halophilum]
MILAHPWWVGVGFHTPFRCSDEPKALRVEPHPPENGLFRNASSPSGNQVGRVVGRRRSFAFLQEIGDGLPPRPPPTRDQTDQSFLEGH